MNAVDVINSFTIKYLKDRDDNLSIKDANKQNPIYQIFRITFGLTSKEFDALAKNLRMAVVCNDYLKEINSDLYLFSYELLSKLKENLKSVGLDELTIKNLIIKSLENNRYLPVITKGTIGLFVSTAIFTAPFLNFNICPSFSVVPSGNIPINFSFFKYLSAVTKAFPSLDFLSTGISPR